MKKLYLLALTLVILGITGVANAQITSAIISGKIVDQKGQTIPGASIVAVNTSTGTKYGTQSNADGRYSIPNVNPGGPYTISASFIGFKKEERTNITLTLGGVTFNFKLTDASTELKAVNITGTPTKNGAGTNVSQAQIRRLPSINRSLQDVTRITPQSANNSFQGTNFRYNNITLDGAINNDAIGFSPSLGGQTNQSGSVGSSTRTSPVSLDAIQDVQVFVAPFDIKIGNVLGGSINAVTRSGTNTVTGSVYGYGRGAFMVGPNNAPANVGGDGAKEPNDFHDYNTGFRLGFPIIKDKLFFFTNEEISRRRDPVISGAGTSGSAAILSLQDAKDLTAAFKAYTTDAAHPNGIDPGTYDNTSIYSNSNKYFNRLDWNINDKNQLTLRNNTITSTATNLERDNANFRFSGIDYTSHNNSTSFVAELKSRLSNNVNNNLLLGYSNVHDYRDPNSDPSLPQLEITGRTPGTTIFMGTDREASIFDMHQKVMEFTDNLTVTKGINTFTFGTHNEFYDITYNFVNSWNGRIAFGSIDKFTGLNGATFGPSRVRTNYYYTDYSANDRATILANPSAKFNVNLLSAYAQDEIQASDNLKITAGIRLDYAGVPTKQPLADRTTSAAVDVNYGNTFTYTKPADIKNNYLNDVQINPRISFNYDPNGDQSVIIRGGTGTFTGRVPFAWFGYAFYNNGKTFGAYDTSTGYSTYTPNQLLGSSANGRLGFVQGQVYTAATAGTNTSLIGQPINTTSTGATQVDLIDNNFKMPKVWRTNLAFDVKTPDQWKFTLEGIYTDVIRDLKFQQVNTVDKVAYYPYDVNHIQPIFVNQKVSSNFTNAYELSNTNQGYRYSITGQAAKSFPFGLDANVAYTYGQSKDVTNGIRNSMESNWQLNQAANPNNPQAAYSNFDIRHRIVSTVNYRLAYGKDKSLVSNFTFFLSAQSGNPYTYGFYNKAIDGTGQQVNVAYIPKVGETINLFSTTPNSPSLAEETQAAAFDQYINSNPYLSSRRGQFTERNAARTPWNTDLDFRFTQDFNVGAKHKQVITITYDIINLTNLLNKDWGHYYFSSNTFNSTASVGLAQKVTPSFANVSTTNPTYTWTDPGTPYQVDLFQSRYQMQLGVRYTF
ncbi:carboxypeptidase family protein [Mucilaginibacter gracilis]|uniref:Carboxypeptidase family protein n=1 Tax=Mucilaginibacter gracilis TaxID=423350 RepID=A0A495J1K9_9SPHI|nr:TonB-dependent receptor [Mucilaginibacter gracilis]RKR82218.1 carboxypeptidase family protein [Mucilaginibacter gracilis]